MSRVTLNDNGELVPRVPTCEAEVDGKLCGCRDVWGRAKDRWVCFAHGPEASAFEFKCGCEIGECQQFHGLGLGSRIRPGDAAAVYIMFTPKQEQRLQERAQVVIDMVNWLRPRFRSYNSNQKMQVLDTIGASVYYLPSVYTNKKQKGYTNHHVYPRNKAARDLLTAPQDATLEEFLKAYKESYGIVTWMTKEEHGKIPKHKHEAP
jgi:hypothetical protein